jgi:hypothetical protein
MFRAVLMLLAFALASPLVATSTASADEIVRYRLETWKAKHLHDAAKADRIAETLQKLGCEVQKADHNGHIDVKYRCPQWRQITLNNHDEVVRWQRWFKEYNFQTEHKH